MHEVIRNIARPLARRVRAALNLFKSTKWKWPSETSKCRPRLIAYCTGYGVDLGFGGDPISPSAIRVDMPTPYTQVGQFPVQLGGDATRLTWFQDHTLDYVYSSHLLEDFNDTTSALVEWLRVLKVGGHLIIFCPDEQLFRKHCAATGQPYNPNHKHEHFSLEYVKGLLAELGQTKVVHEAFPVDVYSWDLVIQKL